MSIGGITDLLESERGIICILLIIASTVLVIVGKLTAEDWLTYTKWIAVTLIASKTVTGTVETIVSRQPKDQKADPEKTTPV